MVHAAAKYAAGAALSVLLVTTLAGVEWLPFAGPRQTLQDLYHHHMLEQQDVADFKSQPEPSMQDMASGLVKRAKSWTPSLRILQGPAILSPDEAPTSAAAAPDDTIASSTASDLGSSADLADSPTEAASGPAGATGGPAAGPGASTPNAAPGVSGAPGCVPIETSSSSSLVAGPADAPEGSLEGPAAAPIPSAVTAAPAPDGTPRAAPVQGVLCQTGSAGGVFVPTG